MRPTLIIEQLKDAHALRKTTYITGAPGGGKTSVVKQAAAQMGVPFKLIHVPTLNPEDLGVPKVDGEWLEFALTSRLPLEGSDCADEGIVILDELPQGDHAVQKTLANLLLEREVYGRKIKAGWSFAATGNREKDRAGAGRVLSHLYGRVTEIEYETSLDDFSVWALDNDVNPSVIQYVRFKPNMLHDFDPARNQNPTPRGWKDVSDYLGVVSPAREFETFKGIVGEGAAAEYVGFLGIYRKLPNPDAVLMDPEGSEVPDESSVRYAIAGALAHRATPDNFDAVLTYMRRLPPEFCVMTILDAKRKNPEVMNTKGFIDWASKEGVKVLL